MSPDAPPPPGWYPSSPGQLRWWDGTGWTEHIALATDAATSHSEIPQPRSIRIAVKIMWANAVLSLLTIVLVLTRIDATRADLKRSLRNSSHPYSQSAYDVIAAFL